MADNSINSSTGSNHGTITIDLSASFNDSNIINSTTNIRRTPTAAAPRRLRLQSRSTGKKDDDRRQNEPLINTSIMEKAFEAFSGSAFGNNNTFSLELPRGNSKHRFQPSPSPSCGEYISYLGPSSKSTTPADQGKENHHSPEHKTTTVKGSPYVSYASRKVDGERRTLTDLHAQMVDGSDDSMLFNGRPNADRSISKTRFIKRHSISSLPVKQEHTAPTFTGSLAPADPTPTVLPINGSKPAAARRLSQQYSTYTATTVTANTHEMRQIFATASADVFRVPKTDDALKPHGIPNSANNPIEPAKKPELTKLAHRQLVSKSSVPKMVEDIVETPISSARHRPQADISTNVSQPTTNRRSHFLLTRNNRSNSYPTAPTTTFCFPSEFVEDTKTIDTRVPVLVREGKIEAPPINRRRSPINGIEIPTDEEHIYRMIIDLNSKLTEMSANVEELKRANQHLKAAFDDEKQSNLHLKEAGQEVNETIAQLKEIISDLQQSNNETNEVNAHLKNSIQEMNSTNKKLKKDCEDLKKAHVFLVSLHGDPESSKKEIENDLESTHEEVQVNGNRVSEFAEDTWQTHEDIRNDLRDEMRNAISSVAREAIELTSTATKSKSGRRRGGRSRKSTSETETSEGQAVNRERTFNAVQHETTQNMTSAYILEDIHDFTQKSSPTIASNSQILPTTETQPVLVTKSHKTERQLETNNLCVHKVGNCIVCLFETSADKGSSSRSKVMVRVERPMPPLTLDLPKDGNDHTLRPTVKLCVQTAYLLKSMQDELEHLKMQHVHLVDAYHDDSNSSRRVREKLRADMGRLQKMVDLKWDQIYRFYDLVEDQFVNGHGDEIKDGMDVTVLDSFSNED